MGIIERYCVFLEYGVTSDVPISIKRIWLMDHSVICVMAFMAVSVCSE